LSSKINLWPADQALTISFMKTRTITAEIALAQIAIENALQHETIQKKLAVYNYDRPKLLEGKSLKEEVQQLHSVKQDKYGEQFTVSEDLKAQIQEVRLRYRQHVKRARLAFENQRGVLSQLQLEGRRKSDMNGWLDQLYTFYSKIEGFAPEMSLYNIGQEELAQTKAMVEALYAARQQHLQCRGNAQDATQKRNAKRRALRTWMSQFKKAARLALADEPQLLEALGIIVPSEQG